MKNFKAIARNNLQWKGYNVLRIAFRLFGRPWNAFYRRLLNFQERRTTLDQILQRPQATDVVGNPRGLYAWSGGEYHLAFMRENGLGEDMRVFDFGCGYGRTGIPLIRYLARDRYVGVDLSDRRIAMAQEWVKREYLEDKQPLFLVSTDNSLPYLKDETVDVVWTWSVFTHMPLDEIRQTLRAMRRVLTPNGIIYFHYVAYLDGEEGKREPTATFKDFYWTKQTIDQVVQKCGFKSVRAANWKDNLDEKMNKDSVMLILSINHTS